MPHISVYHIRQVTAIGYKTCSKSICCHGYTGNSCRQGIMLIINLNNLSLLVPFIKSVLKSWMNQLFNHLYFLIKLQTSWLCCVYLTTSFALLLVLSKRVKCELAAFLSNKLLLIWLLFCSVDSAWLWPSLFWILPWSAVLLWYFASSSKHKHWGINV